MSTVWHNVYYQYAYCGDEKEVTYGKLARLLELARQKDVPGQVFPLTRLDLYILSHW